MAKHRAMLRLMAGYEPSEKEKRKIALEEKYAVEAAERERIKKRCESWNFKYSYSFYDFTEAFACNVWGGDDEFHMYGRVDFSDSEDLRYIHAEVSCSGRGGDSRLSYGVLINSLLLGLERAKNIKGRKGARLRLAIRRRLRSERWSLIAVARHEQQPLAREIRQLNSGYFTVNNAMFVPLKQRLLRFKTHPHRRLRL